VLTRRNWLRNATGLLVAAPFVAKASNLMTVRPIDWDLSSLLKEFITKEHTYFDLLNHDSRSVFCVDADKGDRRKRTVRAHPGLLGDRYTPSIVGSNPTTLKFNMYPVQP
jgi:hypothetical protein